MEDKKIATRIIRMSGEKDLIGYGIKCSFCGEEKPILIKGLLFEYICVECTKAAKAQISQEAK